MRYHKGSSASRPYLIGYRRGRLLIGQLAARSFECESQRRRSRVTVQKNSGPEIRKNEGKRLENPS